MEVYGRSSVYEFLGDFMVYRNLVPADPRLPSLAQSGPHLGLPAGLVPRKSEAEYARVIAYLLQQARAVELPAARIERLVYVGDTRMNDGTAFANLCQVSGWPGLAFIAAEATTARDIRDVPAQVEVVEQAGGSLYLASHWAALEDFERFCRQRGFAVDERMAVVVDLDKTALGARGRNDHVIDRVRIEAIHHTVGNLLGHGADAARFRAAYDTLRKAEFHPFTADNQDYLVYICLIVGSGLYGLDSVVEEVRAGRLAGFEQFIAEVEERKGQLPPELREIHQSIYACVQQGDPTPFKAFRFNEYLATVRRMGHLADTTPVSELLADEIVITQEVREMALAWRRQGALLFGLSDKPDEASLPPHDLVAQGYRAIHRVETHAVGSGG